MNDLSWLMLVIFLNPLNERAAGLREPLKLAE